MGQGWPACGLRMCPEQRRSPRKTQRSPLDPLKATKRGTHGTRAIHLLDMPLPNDRGVPLALYDMATTHAQANTPTVAQSVLKTPAPFKTEAAMWGMIAMMRPTYGLVCAGPEAEPLIQRLQLALLLLPARTS